MNPEIGCGLPLSISFNQLFAFLKDPDNAAPFISAQRFAIALRIDIPTLARLIHVPHSTANHLSGPENMQMFPREALQIIEAATKISSDVQSALLWYRNEPLSHFGDKTAELLVSEGHSVDLLRYIASLEAGAAG